ncbi:MAG: hypothetical protein HZA04_02550 [Nitrospinae bacterium]|nr:hypothetical protein [Nitrospinota bacterium]
MLKKFGLLALIGSFLAMSFVGAAEAVTIDTTAILADIGTAAVAVIGLTLSVLGVRKVVSLLRS